MVYILLVIGLSLAFIGCKALAWQIVFRAERVTLSLWECVRIFSISCLIDVILFPSTVSGDLFKLGYLHREPLGSRIRAILIFRIATTLAYLSFLAVLLSQSQLIAGILLMIVGTFILRRKIASVFSGSSNNWTRVIAFGAVFLITIVTVMIRFFRTVAVAAFLGVLLSMSFIFEFVLSYCSGAVSTIPMGLGVRDFFLGTFLVDKFDAQGLAAFLVLHRLSGEGIGALVGWLFSIEFGLKTIKSHTKRGKEDKNRAKEGSI